jgi:E3 ubiquitin-protein ligase RHF
MTSSAAAFVEGGVQDACDDACSICLESFSDDDPATVTNCKHEYHLQCILEWSQRSKECPMCWQPLSLKDPDNQDLLAAVANERALRRNKVHMSSVHQRPPVEEYEFHRFASYGDEECIMQHLAAAMGRTHHFSRRDPILFQPATQVPGHPQLMFVSSSSGSGGSTPVNSPPVVSSPPSCEAPSPSFSFTTVPVVAADTSALSSSPSRSACISPIIMIC